MIPVPPDLQYRPFQAQAITQMRRMRCIYLADEMGLGKTVQSIGLINDDVTLTRVLIVCPAAVKLNWQRELQRWLCRELDIGHDIVICNYARLQRNPWLQRIPWDLVIFDEAHYLKEPEAKRTKFAQQLAAGARRLLFLSGTPIPNRPIELWTVLNMVDPGYWQTRHVYGERYCAARQQEVPVPPYHLRRFWRQLVRVYVKGLGWVQKDDTRIGDRSISRAVRAVWVYDGATDMDELNQRLRSTLMIRRTKAEVLTDLPPKTRQLVPLECPVPNCVRVLEQKLDEDYTTSLARLEVPDSPGFEELSRVRREIAVAKIPAVIDWVKLKLADVPKLIVFAHHYEMLDALHEALPDAVLVDGRTPAAQRQQAIDSFQTDPGTRLFIGGLRAMGIGVTLTAASHVVLAEIDHVPGNITQAEDRAHRIGQTDPVNVYHLVLDDSLESRMAVQVIAKQRNIDAAIEKEKT